jgi:hypothetical protein
MTTGRITRAVTLTSGDVLEVAGLGSLQATLLASGEVYHPGTNSFTQVSNQLPIAANRLCLAALADGTALDTAEIYDSKTETFAAIKGKMSTARAFHTATLLDSGEVLLAGGSTSEFFTDVLDTAEIYDPKTGSFTAVAGTMTSPRDFFVATLLNSGNVLLPGGRIISVTGVGVAALETAEIYTP